MTIFDPFFINFTRTDQDGPKGDLSLAPGNFPENLGEIGTLSFSVNLGTLGDCRCCSMC